MSYDDFVYHALRIPLTEQVLNGYAYVADGKPVIQFKYANDVVRVSWKNNGDIVWSNITLDQFRKLQVEDILLMYNDIVSSNAEIQYLQNQIRDKSLTLHQTIDGRLANPFNNR